jgi:tetratricopeptide (TPR) repeat protein
MGRYQDAVPCFRRWTELQPDSSRGYQALGTTYHAAGDTRQALVNYEKAISMADDARAYSNLGSLYAGEGRFIDAARAYEKAVALEPGTPAKYKNLGDAYRRLGRDGDARKTYVRGATLSRDLLRVNPKDAAVLSSLAVLEAKLGRPDQASRLAAEAVSLSPSNGEIIYRRAVVHALAGHPVDALKDLRVALTRGASATIAGQDYDLAILRNLPEFKELVGPRS